ncbi:MAG: TraR/DksA family transcriptional regulator [Candidatus Binatia bacterium]
MDAERKLELLKRLHGLRDMRAPLAGQPGSGIRNELPEIEAALGRAAKDAYGVCVSCGNGIAPGRLEVLPATPYCLACAIESARRPGKRASHPTVPFDQVRGEHVGFVTDAELGKILLWVLRERRPAQRSG